uniref:Uncharacterized protein n=1 Tax=Zooxanthella nutricula TaxID=1333877 RepID=A0A7S2VPF0_9DINO
MDLPRPVHWPVWAASFLLMGGQDYFRGGMSFEEHLADAKARVPAKNSTTAILYVNEMPHMPQTALLSAVLPGMLRALAAWRSAAGGAAGAPAPREELEVVLAAVAKAGCWSGRLVYTTGGGAWAERTFGGCGPRSTSKRLRMAVGALGGA